MEEVTYTISQAAKIVGVETYVLRFWEEELLLDIGRNAKGYRAYTKENIILLKKIKELKKDYQLKDIRHMLLDKDQKIDRFLEIMDRVVSETLEVRKSPENRFRKVDMAIRSRQQARKMTTELDPDSLPDAKSANPSKIVWKKGKKQPRKLVAASKEERHKKLKKRSQSVKMDSYTIT